MQRLAFSVRDAAQLLGCSAQLVRDRIAVGSLAHLRLGCRVLVLDGDVFPSSDEDGRHGLARAFRGHLWLRLTVVAASLGCSARALKRLAQRGEFPAVRRCERGWWWVRRDHLVGHLLAQRRPPRWELAA